MTVPVVLTAARAEVDDDLGNAFDEMVERGWTDGLPVIPPTPERVARMVAHVQRAPDEVIAQLAPSGGTATVENIAINAVMAGCRPEYLPVVIAAVEALAQPQFNLLAVQTTTNPVAPFVLINGPVRQLIGAHGGRGALGPGWRANATIGRAVRLIMLNLGGGKPAEIDKATLGFPGKYTFCLGELEEESPWEGFHVEQGFQPEDSVVTLFTCQGTQSVAASYLQPESILRMLVNAMTVWGTNSYNKGDGNPTVILTPKHAQIFHEAGWPKARIKEWLFEASKVPESLLPVEPRLMGHARVMDGDRICICKEAKDIAILVAGGPEAYHLTFLANYGNPMAMAKVRLPQERT
jgi:hypothetical protein